ncbi:MAG: hypothetical protein N3H31_00195 [Candidatus Nezhaarchaeota archaeon]|nr:hypothetical protein [Candidatus Nezhaarchaeota archaeon]
MIVVTRPLVPVLAAASAALALVLIAVGITTRHVETVVSLLFFLALIAASTSLVFMAVQRKPPPKHVPSVVTVVNCLGCDYREEREFKTGDFVFKRLGSCAKCGKELFIASIYSVARTRES